MIDFLPDSYGHEGQQYISMRRVRLDRIEEEKDKGHKGPKGPKGPERS
jgi:hypothetical protein